MLQLRDLARPVGTTEPLALCCQATAGDTTAKRQLQSQVPQDWRAVVAHLARCKVNELTPALFWMTIAKQGGFIGRRSDGWPGWQTLWRGWSRISDIVYGVHLGRSTIAGESCG